MRSDKQPPFSRLYREKGGCLFGNRSDLVVAGRKLGEDDRVRRVHRQVTLFHVPRESRVDPHSDRGAGAGRQDATQANAKSENVHASVTPTRI